MPPNLNCWFVNGNLCPVEKKKKAFRSDGALPPEGISQGFLQADLVVLMGHVPLDFLSDSSWKIVDARLVEENDSGNSFPVKLYSQDTQYARGLRKGSFQA